MGYSNGQLETLETGKGEKGDPGLPGIGFNLTDDGNFDIDNKRLTEVADPTSKNDAATKEYVDDNISTLDLTPYLKRDGSIAMTGDLNMNNHKIRDLEDASNDNEAVSLKQLKEMTDHTPANYHLRPSFTFYKDFGDKAKLTKSNVSIPRHTDHLEQLEAPREGVKDGYAFSSVYLKNNLQVGDTYTILFEIFGYNDNNLVSDGQDDRLLFLDVYGDVNITDFSHEWFDKYAKAHLKFTNSKSDVTIRLRFRYYGSSNSNFKFLFYSRCIRGIQKTKFTHKIFDINSAAFAGTTIYFFPINMNGERIINLAEATGPKGATTKRYVDNENAKQDIAINSLSTNKADKTYVDTENAKQDIAINSLSTTKAEKTHVILRDGSQSMTGNLNMNDNKITDLVTQDDVAITDYPNYVKDSKMAVNKQYVNENFLKLKGDDYDLKGKRIKNTEPYGVNTFDTNDLVSKAFVEAEISKLPKPDLNVLKLDGSRAMTGSLQMGDNPIIGIRSSSADDAALTVGGANSTYLPLLGDRGLQGDLNMGGNAIINIKPFVEDDSSQAAQNAQSNHVINFGYFYQERGDLKREINDVSYEALNRKKILIPWKTTLIWLIIALLT